MGVFALKKVASVSLWGNHYEVDAVLVGEQVEMVLDPFDLTTVEVRFCGRHMSTAVPRHIGRHSHPSARPKPPESTARASGIEYLRLVEQRRQAELARRIDHRELGPPRAGNENNDDYDDDEEEEIQ